MKLVSPSAIPFVEYYKNKTLLIIMLSSVSTGFKLFFLFGRGKSYFNRGILKFAQQK